MKNHYQILGLTPQASTEEIKHAAKMHLINIENNNLLTIKEKNIKKKYIGDAFKTLNDYHKRREYDNQISIQPLNVSNRKNIPFGMSIFNNFQELDNMINSFSTFTQPYSFIDNLDKTSDNKYQSYTSTSQGHLDQHGNWITEKREVLNNNGKIDAKHSITTIDKEGKTIDNKNIPVKMTPKIRKQIK